MKSKEIKKKIVKNKGITLVALVVTIIVLLILAGVSINLIMGNEGIIGKSETAVNEHEKEAATETINFKITNVQIDTYAKEQRMPTLKELADSFCEDDDFQYVLETSQVAALDKIENENPTSIYTKLKAYPYEFEINSSLQLASVDGIKVPSNNNYDKVEVGNVKVEIINVLSRRFTIKVTPDNPEKIATYQYYINGELIHEGMEPQYEVTDLDMNTVYDYEVKIVPRSAVSVGQGQQATLEEPEVEISNKFDKYIYIDANNGNDSTGNGSKQSPYKTLDKIADSGLIENGYSYGVILKDGTYELTEKVFELNCNKSINIIGDRQNTNVLANNVSASDRGVTRIGTTNYEVNINRLIFTCNAESCNYPLAMIYNKITLNNVVLNTTNSRGYAVFYSNTTSANEQIIIFKNCVTPINSVNMISMQSSSKTIKVINSYGGFSSGYATVEKDWNYQTNSITSTPQVDQTTYRITESESVWKDVGTGTDLDGTQADLGVYGGEYSWEWETDIYW